MIERPRHGNLPDPVREAVLPYLRVLNGAGWKLCGGIRLEYGVYSWLFAGPKMQTARLTCDYTGAPAQVRVTNRVGRVRLVTTPPDLAVLAAK